MRVNNVVLNKAYEKCNETEYGYTKASVAGVGIKTLYFVIITFLGAFLGMYLMKNNLETLLILLGTSAIFGFIFAILAMNFPKLSFVFGSLYCLFEGIFLGTVSFLFEEALQGVVLTALIATLAVVLACAVLYITGLVRVTSKFRRFVFITCIALCITTLIILITRIFIPALFANLGLVLLIDGLTCLVACLILISDFDYAYQIISNNGPKELEWMVSFGIAYTVIWLYYEILRIVYIVARRR